MNAVVKPMNFDMDDLIRHAAASASNEVPEEVAARVATMVPYFDAVHARTATAPLNIVTFHLKLPDEHRHIDYVDIKADQGRIDYGAVLRHTFAMARGFNPTARIIYITGELDDVSFVPDDVCVVRLPLKPQWLMYERVVAMMAYMRSTLFDANTAFIDSDAFCNWPLDRAFRMTFDVGVTFRAQPGLMPLNEGVIFAAYRAGQGDGAGAVRFFERYLATYEALCCSQPVIDLYGDIRRWRGGQLSLNGAAAAVGVLSEIDQRYLNGAVVRYLPCEDFNYFVRDNESYPLEVLRRKYVLHLKGPSKQGVAAISAFQRQWLEQYRAANPSAPTPNVVVKAAPVSAPTAKPAVTSADRVYSLDTTAPVDYEPATALDYARASLTDIADHFKTDKGSIKHLYTKVYEQYFAPLRQRAGVQLMEIGIACGSSLKMWSRYFSNARILGVDIRPECATLCRRYPNIEIRIQNATQAAVAGSFDIIIDDGSHVSADIVDTFRLNWPNLQRGGLYVVEDLKCTHNADYRKLLPFDIPAERFDRRHFMELIDRCLVEMDWRRGDIEFIHFYKEMVVIKKAA